MKREIKQVIRNLIKKVKKIELINYKVASDEYFIFYEIDEFNYETVRKLRKDENLEDFGYFSSIRNIFDEYIWDAFPEKDEDPDKVLRLIKNITPPDGALTYYADRYYLTIINDIINQTIILNNTLDKEEQLKEVSDLQQEMEILQAKRYISPKELSQLLPNMSISQQQTYRGRIKNKIPYHQATSRGGVTYIVEDVKEWMENNNIR